MMISKIFSVLTVLAIGTASATLPVAQASSINSVGSCVQVKEWVDALPTLPSSLDEYSKLDIPYQREVYRRLSPTQKAALWQAHFEKFKDVLTSTELRDLLSLRMLITANALALSTPIVGMPTPQGLSKMFDTPEHPHLAVQLFDINMLGSSPSLSTFNQVQSHAPGDVCECSISSDWCTGECREEYPPCQGVGLCGTLGQYICTGMCREL